MTEPRFEELINLYLDNEIGRHELGELKSAIRDNVLRRQKFERACQLHQAARKALTTREDNPADEGPHGRRGEGNDRSSSSPPESRSSASGGRQSRSSGSSSGMSSVRHKQSQAHRNAAVSTMAERQSSKGAASSVDATKINLDSGRTRGSGGPVAFSFFDSPAGMAIAGIFIVVGVTGLYFLLKIGTPDEPGSASGPGGDSIISAPGGPIDQKELMRELQRGRRGSGNPAEALHATIYQSAAGQPAANVGSGNSSTPSADSAPSSVMLPDAAKLNPPNTNMTVQISPTTMSTSGNGNVGAGNSTEMKIALPSVIGMPGNQDQWVKMSLPPLVTPPADSSTPVKPANDTMPQVHLP